MDEGKEEVVERRMVNPWTWQDNFGYSQAIEVSGAQRTIYCAGQTSTDGEGNPVHPEDMRAQINYAFDNLETVLRESGAGLSDVVRLNYYYHRRRSLLRGARRSHESLGRSWLPAQRHAARRVEVGFSRTLG
jgi:enamine deaminase RidA (YjgF/YER057c/UK114 family)